jgi:hypothetical protein
VHCEGNTGDRSLKKMDDDKNRRNVLDDIDNDSSNFSIGNEEIKFPE